MSEDLGYISLLREASEQARLEREKNAQVLEGLCPACNGTTRYPLKKSRKLSCQICCDEETPGRVARPRSWWMSVVGREP